VQEDLPEACGERKAIDFEQQEQWIEIEVGSIIVSTGFKTFDPARQPQYGYGTYPNVYTSLEVERLVNASGPTGGEVICRDGKKPRAIGIIHCVGSRDKKTNVWCSRVCCMYSMKLAHLLKEHSEAELYNFYIDIRAPGKGYEEFYNKLAREGIHFIRGRVGEVTDWAMTPEEEGKLVIRVEDTLAGVVRRIPVDMVVLATGLEPQADAGDVRRLFNMSCGGDGWFLERHPKLAPVSTFTDGVFLAGCCQGPRDIPDTVAQAGAAAAEALVLIDKGYIEQEPNTAYILDPECSGCRAASRSARTRRSSSTTAARRLTSMSAVQGLRTCVGSCPSGSIVQNLFEDRRSSARSRRAGRSAGHKQNPKSKLEIRNKPE
jgi:heterodisulfide reductase subunit A